MANTFLTPDKVLMDAPLMIRDKLGVAYLANRKYEGQFGGAGSSVRIKVPTSVAASEFASTTSAASLTEVGYDLVVEKHFYTRIDLTADQLTLSVDAFNEQIQMPVMSGLANAIEEYALDKLVGGLVRSVDSGTSDNIVGTAGNEPSTHAHIVAATKQIKINKGDMSQLVGVITPTAEASFKQLNLFTSADYGADRPMALQDGSLGRLDRINWFSSPDASSAFSYGSIAGTVVLNGAGAVGDTTLAVDGFDVATGTVKEGTQFTIAGTATIYTVTKDAIKAGSAATLTIYPALTAIEADGDAITFLTPPTQNAIFNPACFAGAIVVPPAASANTFTSSFDGIGVRVIADTSTSTLATSWVWDTYAAFKVVEPKHGVIFQG